MKFVISQDADRDIADITRYTRRNWGDLQARRYAIGISQKIRALATRPDKGWTTEGVPAYYLKVAFQSHFVFYRIIGDTVLVVRVLHQQMDFGRHLN